MNSLKKIENYKIKILSMALVVLIIIDIFNTSFANIDENNMTIIETWNGIIPYQYNNEDRISVNRATKINGLPVYIGKKNNNGVNNFKPNKLEKCEDLRIVNILKNGFGCKTMEQLGCEHEVQAFLATQEAIYIKLEERNVKEYQTFDNEGEHIIEVAEKILENSEKENDKIETIPNIEIVTNDTKWKNYEEDNNFKYKEYKVISNVEEDGEIKIEKGENLKIVDSKTKVPKDTFKANDRFYLLVPKKLEQDIDIKFSYKQKQFSVYTFRTSDKMEDTYFIPQMEDKEVSTSIKEKVEVSPNVKIINTDDETGELIQGNTFSILSDDYNPIKEGLVTNEQGIINVFLDSGVYYLKQTESIGKYNINKSLIKIEIIANEDVVVNLQSTIENTEESTSLSKEVNIIENNKKVIENNIKEVSNIKITNINKEIINQTNETNLNNVNKFINTINRKNVLNLNKENTYMNYIEEFNLENRALDGENKVINMSRKDYINYIDMIMLNSSKIPILPVASK